MILRRQQQQQQQVKNSVTKKDPHVGKKNFYYFFNLVRWNGVEVKKSFPISECLITNIQGVAAGVLSAAEAVATICIHPLVYLRLSIHTRSKILNYFFNQVLLD
jgi:hypothetical protein